MSLFLIYEKLIDISAKVYAENWVHTIKAIWKVNESVSCIYP